MFYSFLAIFIPSVLGLKLLDYLNRGLTLKNTIYYYFILVILSNLFNSILCPLVFGIKNNVYDSINYYPSFFGKYVLVSIIINILLAIIIVVLRKSFKLEIEEKKNEKKSKKTIKSKK